MSSFLLEREILIPSDIQTVWSFFSAPGNLAKITPTYLNFKELHQTEVKEIYSGMKIEYKVSPIFKIPMKWETLIKDVVPLKRFVDVQKKGPYKVWEHTHIFETTPDGVLMKDSILYELPFGPLGTFAHWLFIKKQLEDLFNYRTRQIKKYFP